MVYFFIFFFRKYIFTFFFLVWNDDYSKLLMIGFSLIPIFKVRLPKSSLLNLNIHIRDKVNSIREYNISSIYVDDDLTEIENLKDSKTILTNNSFVNGLLTGNQNDIGQIIISISKKLEKINNDNLNNIISSKMEIYFIEIK